MSLNRFRSTLLTLLLLLGTATWLGSGGGHEADAGTPTIGHAWIELFIKPMAKVPDPFPIRREFIPESRLTSVLEQAQAGSLIRMSRETFEQQVQAAGQQTLRQPPALVEARYHATLDENGLQGSASWQFWNVGPTSGRIRLEPLQVSLKDAYWNKQTPAYLFHPKDGKAGTVDVVPHTSGVLHASWSVRSIDEPSAQRFRFALPSAPVSILTLELPVDRQPIIDSSLLLLTGPMPGHDKGLRRWSISLGNATDIELTIRRANPVNQPLPLMQADRLSEVSIEPDVGRIRVEFDLDRLRGQPEEMLFAVDPELRILGITGNGRFTWQTDAQDESRIRISNIDSGSTNRLVFEGLARVDLSGKAWKLPSVRLLNSVPGDDRIRVTVDPTVEFVDCLLGEYQLETITTEVGYQMNLVGDSLNRSGTVTDRQQPSFRLKNSGPSFTSEDAIVWTPRPGRPILRGEFSIRVDRGPLVKIPVRIPKGYDVQSVEMLPDDGGLSWSYSNKDHTELDVMTGRALPYGSSRSCSIKLLGPPMPLAPDPSNRQWPRHTVELPRLTLPTATSRSGSYTIEPAPAFQISGKSLPNIGQDAESWIFPIGERSPSGPIEIRMRRPQVTTESDIQLSLTGNELIVRSKLLVECLSGEVGQLTVTVPRGGTTTVDHADAEVTPISHSIHLANQLAGLVSPTLASCALIDGTASPSVWHVDFAQPLRGSTTIQVETRLTDLGTGAILLPLPHVLGTFERPAKVQSEAFLENLYRIVPTATSTDAVEYHLEPLDRRTVERDTTRGVNVIEPQLRVDVDALGRRICVFTLRAETSSGGRLHIRLPDDVDLLSIDVAQRRVDRLSVGGTSNDFPLALPEDAAPIPVEIRYRLPAVDSLPRILIRPRIELTCPMPEAGLQENLPIRCEWHFDSAFVPWPLAEPDRVVTGLNCEQVTVVTWRFQTLIGITIALILATTLLILYEWKGESKRWLLANVLAAGSLALVNLLLPATWWPIIGPSFLVAMTGLVIAIRSASPRSNEERLGSTRSYMHLSSQGNLVNGLLILLLLSSASSAQAPEPATVYVVPATDATPNQWDVLVPKPILTRLQQAAEPADPAVLMTKAEFEGTVDPQATFTAKIQIQVTRPGTHPVVLPLADVQLLELTVDGEPAFPNGSTADQYQFDVTGEGTHQVMARFAVSAMAMGPNREIRFGTPSIPTTHISFTAPAGASQLDIPSRWGTQVLITKGESSSVSVEHGAANVVVIRWRTETDALAKGTISVRQACLWEIGSAHAEASVAMSYRIVGLSTNRLTILIPPDIEPSLPNVVSLTDGKTLGLQSWSIREQPDRWRMMRLDLQSSVEGNVAVLFRMVPRTILNHRPVLESPRATRVQETTHFLAVRADEGVIADWNVNGLDEYPLDTFLKEFGTIPKMNVRESPPSRVWVSRDASPIHWQPQLGHNEPITAVSGTVDWNIDTQATASGTVRVRGPTLGRLQLSVPSTLELETVRCPGLRSWTRAGQNVHIWLDQPASDVAITWTGRYKATRITAVLKETTKLQLPFPIVVAPSAVPQPIELQVSMATGWTVRLVQPSTPLPLVMGSDDHSFTVRVQPPQNTIVVEVETTPKPHTVRLLEIVKPTETGLHYQARLQFSTAPNQASEFVVRLDRATNTPLPQITHSTDIALSLNETTRSWRVWATPGKEHSITWEFDLPRNVPLPTLELWYQKRVEPSRHWFAVPTTWVDRLQFGPGWQPLSTGNAPPHFASFEEPHQLWQVEQNANRPTLILDDQPSETLVQPRSATETVSNPSAAILGMDVPSEAVSIRWKWMGRGSVVLIWLIGFGTILLSRQFLLDRFRPEQVVAVGLLGLIPAVSDSKAMIAFGIMILAGLFMRLCQVARRLAAVMLR